MKRKYIFILTGIVAVVLLVMTFLKASVKEMNGRPNGFKRVPVQLTITKLMERSFSQPLRDIAGIMGDSIFIVTANPSKLIVINSELKNEKLIELPLSIHKNLAGNFTTRLYNNELYIFGSNVPCVIRFNIKTGREEVFPVNRAYSRSAVISPNTIVIRGFNAQFKDEDLRIINLGTGVETEEKGITDKTEGGGFVTDGMLHYDEKNNEVVYHHFYSNKLIVLDSNLQLLRKGTTIDTFSNYTAKATAHTTSKGIYYSFSAPPKLLSDGSCVSDGRLFIHSRLKADNDTREQFLNFSTIDVYDLRRVAYTGSIYMPVLPEKRLIRFTVLHDKLYAIYDNRVVVYRMH